LESKNIRKGFTLIEVMISVMIVSIVGIALLEISTNNTKMIGFLSQKRELRLMFLNLIK